MSEELLPCPFCGNDEIAHQTGRGLFVQYVCGQCGAGPDHVTEHPPESEIAWVEAAKLWNRRA
jgi:hypothetical protein